MVVKRKTTESSRRHAFSSFKDRIDSIRIEPSKKLTKRPYDTEVETSYFLTTLQHWREINLSKIFTEFYDSVEQKTQSLPQLIYHQSNIYESLSHCIGQNDVHSLQPLLECLTQFIHDLGPDFMPYYIDTLDLLMKIVIDVNPNDLQNNRNSSNVLEYTFNCLAFMFKYLSQYLITDLIPTLQQLMPILKLIKKRYISRFCCEALSFLIKKSDSEALGNVIKFTLYDQEDSILSNAFYCESISILYSESMKNTKGTFHTKSKSILTSLLNGILFEIDNYEIKSKLVGILCDILLDLMNYGTTESCDKFYILITNVLNELIQNTTEMTLLTTCQLLSCLSFAESGRKINDWSPILNTVELLIEKLTCLNPSCELTQAFIYLICIIFRNGDIQSLTKNYNKYFKTMMKLNQGDDFLLFAQSSLSICKEKVVKFGLLKYIQEYVDEINHDDQLPKLAYFIKTNNLQLQIPKLNISLDSSTEYEQTYWKLVLSNYTKEIEIDEQVLQEILTNLDSSPLQMEIAALITQLFVKRNNTFIVKFIDSSFEKFQQSANFISAVTEVASKLNQEVLIPKAIEGLNFPNHNVRLKTIILLQSLTESNYLSQIRIIEEIPLTVSNSRDIILRIRNLALEFQKDSNITLLDKQIVINYLFGLLSNKFQPSWNGVFEALPLISNHSTNELIWKVAFKLLNKPEEENDEFEIITYPNQSRLINWQPNSSKLLINFQQFNNRFLTPYLNINSAMLDICKNEIGQYHFDEMAKINILQGLKTIPNVADSHTNLLIPILTEESSWPIKQRNGLLELFTKIKSLKKKASSEQLYQYVLNHLLTSSNLKTQQLALDVLFNFNNPVINKYRDNLKNLLDDTIFSDEISIFLSPSSSVTDEDRSELMVIIIRILFGRVQGSPKSNSKSGKKFQVISVLPSLTNDEIISFIEIGSGKLNHHDYFNHITPKVSLGLDINELKKINGFVNLLSEIYDTLGANYHQALQTTIEPLVFALVSAQNCIEIGSDDVVMDKIAKSIRSTGMRCMNELFKVIGDSFDWSTYYPVIYDNLICPRLDNFANENLQQPSSLLNLITTWINHQNTVSLLYVDDFSIVKAIMSILSKSNDAKESVIVKVLDFSIDALERKDELDDRYFTLLALVVDALLTNLPQTIINIHQKEVGSRAIKLLLLLITGKYIEDNETKSVLIKALTIALEKNNNQIDLNDKANILLSLSSLINEYNCEFDQIEPLYKVVSKMFRLFPIRTVRETLSSVMVSIGSKFDSIGEISNLLVGLNSYTVRGDYDFEQRLDAFKLINEEMYPNFTPLQWLPLINCGLFFINDPEELAIRNNASYMIKRFIDCYSNKSEMEAQPYIHQLKDIIIPNLKIGIRKENEDIQSEYISILEHLVNHSQHYTDLNDMKILSQQDIQNDEEDTVNNFFQNINNIQIYRRHRAIRKLIDYKSHLNENSISHYILPMIEKYVVTDNEKYRNLGLEALETIGVLLKTVTWNQYKAILKRYIANLKNSTNLKQRVNLIVSISHALYNSKLENSMQLPSQEELDNFILFETSPSLLKILNVRDDDTIVARAPLSEALINFILCITPEKIDLELPKILTNLCQVMRSRSEELRDAVRKSLGKIANSLGPVYFPFIIKELKTALSRGSQIHVLSYTVHYLSTCISQKLYHGDLDESINLLIDIVMEDIFGAAGQEKDAEGYTSKMKEVKFKKSFDTVEILTSNISLNQFGELINPIKLLLNQNISHKTQLKLDELLRRISLGLNHNQQSNKIEILHLCYQIFQMSKEEEVEKDVKQVSEKEKHFLTTLDRKPVKARTDTTLFKQTMQRLSLELLRTAISRHDNLMTVASLQNFIPLLEEAIKSENEQVIIGSMKILIIIIRLPFDDEVQNVFKSCTRRSLVLIKNSPSTNSDICQTSLKFLSTTIRHSPELNLKESAISYILSKIQPDLEEPNKQGLAFNFLKSVVSQHIMIPEIYDLMDNVAKIMIVNHSKEIRDMSRSVYFQFLMEYDQGKGRLEKQFKYLVTNLSYPTEEGRASIMELIHLIILKSGNVLLTKLSTSFFVSLANVLISDTSNKCREMANSLISSIFKKLPDITGLEKFILSWLKQSNNQLLKRCGLNVYKIYIQVLGTNNDKLNQLAKDNITHILNQAKNSESSDDIGWELIYTTLSTFTTMASIQKEKIFNKSYESIWDSIIEISLYPHSWIRLIACRLITLLLTNLDDLKFEFSELNQQLVSTKLIHQMRAPSISEDLGNQIVKSLVLIAMNWEKEGQHWINDDDNDQLANDYLLDKICGIIKQENLQSINSKRSCIKLSAMFIQFTQESRLLHVSEMIVSALYNFTDPDYSKSVEDEELLRLSTEALDLMKGKIGTTDYTSIYSKVKLQVTNRRQERRAKKAQLAISQPDVAAKRKFKKHERFREKRKHERDENGYYKPKKKRTM